MKRLMMVWVGMLCLWGTSVSAQVLNPTQWKFAWSKSPVKVGEEVDIVATAQIDETWYVYSNDFDPDLGPQLTEFQFKPHPGYALVGKVKAINPKEKFDDIWGGKVRYFVKKAEFRQRVKILATTVEVSGSYEGQVCTEVDGKCIPMSGDFTLPALAVQSGGNESTESSPVIPQVEPTSILQTENTTADTLQPRTTGLDTVTAPEHTLPTSNGNEEIGVSSSASAEDFSFWGFFFFAFASGLVALLTPCVFPMIPMTVTFFTKRSGSRAAGIRNAGVYGASIVAIYTLIGTVIARINGPEFANFLSTHWVPNLLFFVIFVVFGMSFLGMFEIVLPAKWVNAADRQADKGGLYGVFFMAFTLVLVSFSCTGPVVGAILVQSAGGEWAKPIVGMLGYSLAFALPFTLFALFPQWLTALPKSGGWLNSVKVVLGFLELALALKFLSIPDQVYHWGLLDREVYLSFWIVIFFLMGYYLLGKLRLPHDSELKHLGVPRLLLAICVFSFTVYLVPGLFGAPLKALAGYLPPETSLDFNLNQRSLAPVPSTDNTLCEKPKYAEFLHLPHQLSGYFDLKQAQACAKATNKPIFIDFTGHGCVNCREMEARVWSDPQVLKRLREDYVVVALYVDDKTELPAEQWYVSPYDNKEKKSIGKQNADYQIRQFQANSQPLYVLMDAEGNLLTQPRAYDLDVSRFTAFLDEGLSQFKKRAYLRPDSLQ